MAGALAGLVDKGLVAPDWAEALAPVDERIAAMGQFLRAEIAAGRPYLPAGDHILRAFQRPLADVRVLIVGQDPYPTPGHPIGLSFAVDAHVRPLPPSLRNIYPARHRPRSDHARPRRPDRVGGPRRDAAQQGAHRAPERLQQPPRARLGGDHLLRHRRSRAAWRARGRDPLGCRRPDLEGPARPRPMGRVGPPQPPLGPQGVLRLPPFPASTASSRSRAVRRSTGPSRRKLKVELLWVT